MCTDHSKPRAPHYRAVDKDAPTVRPHTALGWVPVHRSIREGLGQETKLSDLSDNHVCFSLVSIFSILGCTSVQAKNCLASPDSVCLLALYHLRSTLTANTEIRLGHSTVAQLNTTPCSTTDGPLPPAGSTATMVQQGFTIERLCITVSSLPPKVSLQTKLECSVPLYAEIAG